MIRRSYYSNPMAKIVSPFKIQTKNVHISKGGGTWSYSQVPPEDGFGRQNR